ncbi:MAG: TVP38/TMEM64 family protein [Pirellulaceae bacterium]
MQRKSVIKLVVLISLIAVLMLAFFQFRDVLSLEKLAEQEERLRQLKQSSPLLVFGAAFVLYVAVTGLSLPGATGLSLVYGWFFGWIPGVILVSFASTSGATVAFLLSRYLFRDAIEQKFGERLAAFDRNLEQDGAFYLFTLRLIPAVPFFVINVVMGLTKMKTWTYWWVSQVGMLPGTLVYLYAGSSVPSLRELAETGVGGVLTTNTIIAFVILGLFPITIKKIMDRFRRRDPSDENDDSETNV